LPLTNAQSAKTAAMAGSISSLRVWYWAFRSTKATFIPGLLAKVADRQSHGWCRSISDRYTIPDK